MAGYVAVGLSLSTLILVISLVGPLVGPHVQPLLGITVDATLLTLFFFVFATIYNAILLSTIAFHDRRTASEGEAEDHHFSLMVPCRNEEAVVEQTLQAIMRVDYPSSQFEVLVVNDGSMDRTEVIVRSLTRAYANLRVLNVPFQDSGKGKGEALNKGFRYLLESSPFRNSSNWIIGVFDSDGIVDPKILKKASYSLKDSRVGAVQTLVRISNSRDSVLTMMQDIEFVTFAKVTQSARSLFKGAVALGGNGQFIRASALEAIVLPTGEYWRREALTEDLDLGTRVLMKGWGNSFLSSTAVYQKGVTSMRSLYKQRTRWSWGALQCFYYYAANLRVLRSKMGRVRKLDLAYYLSAVTLPPLILLVWVLSIFGLLGLFRLYNPFPAYFMLANSISFFPLIGYGLWTVRREYKVILIVPLLFLTSAYTYHWVVCTLRAMIHMIMRDKPRWVVTKKTSISQSKPESV